MFITKLDSRALVRISGPDTRSFLQNLLTQDVETLATGEVRYGALLSPPGRLLFDIFIWGLEDSVLLDVASMRRDALIQRLTMYKLRAKVSIESDDRTVWVSWPGKAQGFTVDPRTPLMGGRGLASTEASNATEADYHGHRLQVGLAEPERDAGDDRTYPIEANFDLLNGIDFAKGCFVGQETTSRMKRRGAIRSRMLPVDFEGPSPSPGSEVLNGDRRAGEILTGVQGSGIALLRLDRLEGQLLVEGRPVHVRWPEWMPEKASKEDA
jgi:folate-binding protein YgfZ